MGIGYRVVLILLFPALLSAQNILITFQKPTDLFVCGMDTFYVHVLNAGLSTMQSAKLTALLPVGLTYLPGTVVGATEQNVSNLGQPVFTLPNLAPGASQQVALLITADCAAKKAIDLGQVFTANLSVQSAQGNAQIVTTPFTVQTGLLFLGFVDNSLASGEHGDMITRTIYFRNTRLGPISSFVFRDTHNAGLNIDVPNASGQSSTPTFFQATFDGSFFSQFGDGDNLLEIGEQAFLTEKITIADCGEPAYTNFSKIRIGWGCGTEICQYDSTTASIDIKKSTRIPDLQITPIWSAPESQCGDRPTMMGVKIWNKGKADAENVLLNFSMSNETVAGMKPGTFRMVGKNGTSSVSPNLMVANTLASCGLSFLKRASFSLPKVVANDSLLFLFDVYTCMDSCNQALPGALLEYFYKKPCPVNGFVSDTLFVAPDAEYLVSSALRLAIGSCFKSGNSYPFTFLAGSKRLNHSKGFLHLEFSLPYGLSIDPACPLQLAGVQPSSVTSVPGVNQSTTVHFTFPLPISADSVKMPLCIYYQCDTNMICVPDTNNIEEVVDAECGRKCFVDLGLRTYWTPASNTPSECGIGTCQTMPLVLGLKEECSIPDTTGSFPIEPVPDDNLDAKIAWKYQVYRLNFGLADDNNDRTADGTGIAAAAGLRRDRFLPGDTLRLEYAARIDSGSLDTLYRYVYHELVRSDINGGAGNDAFDLKNGQFDFTSAQKIRYARTILEVHYADGTQASCPVNEFLGSFDRKQYKLGIVNTQPASIVDELVTMRTTLLVPFAHLNAIGLLPKASIELGDSVVIYTDFEMDLNFTPFSSNLPDPPLVGFRTSLTHSLQKYAWNKFPSAKLQYSGFKETRSVNQFSIKPCENSSLVKPFRWRFRIARENMFPFEVRPLANISTYRQSTPAGLEIASSKLQYLVLQDSVPRLKDFPLAVTPLGNWAEIDFTTAFTNPVDEGFSLALQTTFLPNCQFSLPDTSRQVITFNYASGLKEPSEDTDSLTNKLGFFSNNPDVRLATQDTVAYSAETTFDIDFSLRNWVVPPAPQLWLAVISASGLASNFEIIQLPGGQALPGKNNIFQLNTLQGFTQRNLRLRGRNVNCDPDSLMLVYGWGCAPLTDLSEANCWRDTFHIELRLQNPELELDVKQEPTAIKLCEVSDFFELEIYNAKIGYGYDPFATVKLPPGLNIVPGSCQISYPVGSAFVNIADPESLPGNTSRWRVADIQPGIAANGLPGVNLAPQNALRIRFRTIAACGFVSNAQPIYGARATEPCGRSTNVLNKPGKPLNILGLNPTYGVQVNLEAIGGQPVFCGGSEQYEVQLNLLGQPSLGDSVYVLLPTGVGLQAGSYVPGQNAAAGPPTLIAGGFRLALSTNLGAGSVVKFQFSAAFSQSAGCLDQTIVVQTRVRNIAFCQTSATHCTVYVTTGESFLNINPLHPELSLSQVSVKGASGGPGSASVQINNIGNVPANGTTVQFWRDLDGDGTVSAGDIMVGTFSNLETIPAGGSITALEGNLNLSTGQLCELLVVLPAAENCACAPQIFKPDALEGAQEKKHFCNLDPVEIGIPQQPGANYQWINPPAGLFCATCPTTALQPDPATAPGQELTLILEEKTSTCVLRYHFLLTFGQTASMSASNAMICKGSPTTLTVTAPGATGYKWKGFGIQNPALAQQTVIPATSSIYLVTVTFDNACTATATAAVTLLPSDSLQLPTLTTCPGFPVQVPGRITEVAGIYAVKILKSNGCDSTIWQELKVLPNLNTTAQRSICKGDTLLAFDTLLTQNGQVCRKYTAKNGCDSTHCITASFVNLQPGLPADPDTIFGDAGKPITLSGPSGYSTYTWSPIVPNCSNCSKIEVEFDSAGLLTYTLTVRDPNGCDGTITYRVLFSPPCDQRKILMPNAFTPNGDGLNDIFRAVPFEDGGLLARLTIYDRWGEKVYENRDEVAWDGILDGKPAQSDVYVWVIEVDCGNQSVKKFGEVTLLR